MKRVSVPPSPASIDALIDPFAAALTDRTRVLSLTHVSNVSGIRLPVRELCEVAHRRGIHVHVDGAQSWGALDVDLRELGCDSYAASAHKWFMGPKEAGLLYVREDRIGEIWPNIVAPGWGSDAEPDVRGARKFESLGQRDDACLAAVGTGAEFHAAIGAAEVEGRVIQLATTLKEGMAELGMTLVTPMDPDLSGGVCIIEVPGDRRAALDGMYEEHGDRGGGDGGTAAVPACLQHEGARGACGGGDRGVGRGDSGVRQASAALCPRWTARPAAQPKSSVSSPLTSPFTSPTLRTASNVPAT